jgi:hypothetical protein
MPWIDSLDWSSLNALRRYPLREDTSALSVDENFSIPDTLIVDFTLCATSDVTARFYISKVFNKITSVTIEVSDQLGAVVGTAEIDAVSHTEDQDYYLTITNTYVGANGKITIGSLTDLNHQPAGAFIFDFASTEFEPRTIVPGLHGIDRIQFIDSVNGVNSLSGNVVLSSRSNLLFTYRDNEVIWDAGDNLGLNKDCAVKNCVKSINGVVPNPLTGDIGLLGINCINVFSSQQYTLNFEDTCCTPCSGCNDLEELTTRLTSLENKFLTLKDSYNSVNSQLTTYLATINSNCAC